MFGFRKAPRYLQKAVLLVTLLMVMPALIACADQATPPEALPPEVETIQTPEPGGRGAGGTLRLLYWQAPTILNPHLSAAGQDWAASRATYEPLATYDKEGNLVLFLAAEIPTLENGGLATDGKSVTWRLKQGVRWSDGELFTAHDVRFTYEFITNPEVGSTSAPMYDAVRDVQVIDDYTVRIHFKDVNPAWSLPFVGIQGMIIPRHIFRDYNGANAQEAPANIVPVGTGPYRVIEPGIKPQEVLFLGTQLVETNKIAYEPNPYFREDDKPFFSRVELRGGGIVEEAARLVLQTGDVDFAYNLQLEVKRLAQMEREGGNGKVVPNPGPYVERLVLNFTDPNRETNGERSSRESDHPFFSDKRVRQAFAYAIDREAIAELYAGGRATSNILVSPANYQSPNTSHEFDLAKAAALLDEAGWRDTDDNGIRDKDGYEMKVVFQTSENALRQTTQRIIQGALRSIQVDVEIEFTPSSIFFSSDPSNPNTYRHFYADIQEFNEGNQNPDPGAYMQYYTCGQIPQRSNEWKGENTGRWCNRTYDALHLQSTTEVNPEERLQLFIQMNDLLIEDVALIPLVHRARVIGVSATLEGVDLTPWDADLWNIKDWRRISQ